MPSPSGQDCSAAVQEDGHGTAQGMTEHRLEPAAASGM